MGEGQAVAHTFLARHGGLKFIEIYLVPSPAARGVITLSLKQADRSTDLVISQVSVTPGSPPSYYRFEFAPIASSRNQYFVASWRYDGTGDIRVPAHLAPPLSEGYIHSDETGQLYQANFRLGYNLLVLGADLAGFVLSSLSVTAALGVLLSLIGYPIVRSLAREWNIDFTGLSVLSAVCGINLWLLVILWAHTLGLRITRDAVLLMTLGGAFAGFLVFVHDKGIWASPQYWFGQDWRLTCLFWTTVLGALAIRVVIGRVLVTLPGSDMYHHTLITQLFIEQEGLPSTYEPYADLTTFSYHWGFHAIAALYEWLLPGDSVSAVKDVALVMNGVIAAGVGVLTERMTGSRQAGVVAAAVTGLVAVSPFALLKWGRVTQTAGLLLLPMAMLAPFMAKSRRLAFIPAIFISGLVLTHVRIAFYWALFILVGLATTYLRREPEVFKRLAFSLILSALLVSPHLLRVFHIPTDVVGLRLVPTGPTGYSDLARLEEPVIRFPTNWPLLAVSVSLGVIAALHQKLRLAALTVGLWSLVIVLGAIVASVLNFTFWDLITALLTLPIPLAIIAGLGFSALSEFSSGTRKRAIRGVMTTSLLIMFVISLFSFPGVVYSSPSLRKTDVIAMEWIRQNVPTNGAFVADFTEFDWSPNWIVGIGPGYWIPLLTGRSSLIPPMIYPIESMDRNVQEDLDLLQRVYDSQDVSDRLRILKQSRATYIFTGNWSTLFPPQQLSQTGDVKLIYRFDDVWVFELLR